jgi:Fe2+ transport system protein FeoA
VLDRGLLLNTPVHVIEKEPFEGPLTIDINGTRRIIGHNIAQTILVEVDPSSAATAD